MQQEKEPQKIVVPTVRKVQIVKRVDLMPQEEPNIAELKAEEEDERNDQNQESSQMEQEDPFLNFVNCYSVFMNESRDCILDLDVVLDKLNEGIQKYPPPQNSSSTIQQFYDSLQISKESVNVLAQQLKQLPDAKLSQCIQHVEQLNIKLLLEYNVEVKRGKTLGIINNEEAEK